MKQEFYDVERGEKKFVVYLPIVGEGKKPVKQRTLKIIWNLGGEF